MAELPHKSDLIGATEDVCRRQGIQNAVFQVIGAVSLLTIGTFDQVQRVYVTDRQEGSFEIVFCSGIVSRQDGRCFVNSRIIAADLEGRLIGGTVFSDTRIYAAEIDLQEMLGNTLKRAYDPATGLMLWQNFNGGFE
jgi:predicted DNA-binding protein with PD1-like motif